MLLTRFLQWVGSRSSKCSWKLFLDATQKLCLDSNLAGPGCKSHCIPLAPKGIVQSWWSCASWWHNFKCLMFSFASETTWKCIVSLVAVCKVEHPMPLLDQWLIRKSCCERIQGFFGGDSRGGFGHQLVWNANMDLVIDIGPLQEMPGKPQCTLLWER